MSEITKRDLFAAHALGGCLSHGATIGTVQGLAKDALDCAEALLAVIAQRDHQRERAVVPKDPKVCTPREREALIYLRDVCRPGVVVDLPHVWLKIGALVSAIEEEASR